MKLCISGAALLAILRHAQAVVERRNSTIPILSNVLLDATGEMLKVISTDLDMQITEVIEAEIEAPGAITVSAHLLFEIARKLSDGSRVEMAAADGKVIVTGGFARFEMPTLPSVDFPALSDGELPVAFAMEVATLKALIDRTRFAISTEETRFYLNGLFLHAPAGEEPVLKAAATDGHRLAVVTLPLPEDAEDLPDIIIGRKCVAVVRKMLDGAEGLVEISVSQSRIRFHLGTAIIVSKLIDGTFPDYTRVIPTVCDKLLLIDPRRLMQGVDRVATIASDKTRAVKMAIDRDKVALSVTSPENGIAIEEIAGDYGDAPIDIGMNARYLLDVLGQIGSDAISVAMSGSADPVLIRDAADPSATYVIMPMRV